MWSTLYPVATNHPVAFDYGSPYILAPKNRGVGSGWVRGGIVDYYISFQMQARGGHYNKMAYDEIYSSSFCLQSNVSNSIPFLEYLETITTTKKGQKLRRIQFMTKIYVQLRISNNIYTICYILICYLLLMFDKTPLYCQYLSMCRIQSSLVFTNKDTFKWSLVHICLKLETLSIVRVALGFTTTKQPLTKSILIVQSVDKCDEIYFTF